MYECYIHKYKSTCIINVENDCSTVMMYNQKYILICNGYFDTFSSNLILKLIKKHIHFSGHSFIIFLPLIVHCALSPVSDMCFSKAQALKKLPPFFPTVKSQENLSSMSNNFGEMRYNSIKI